jgi:protein-L-isoaspartate(D-aspartate) O-methyltransferase
MRGDNLELIQRLKKEGYLTTPRIIRAFEGLPRELFVRKEDRQIALNPYSPLLIPGRQATISAPNVNATILELLQPQSGEKILDIGMGSGRLAGLMAKIVGENGRVYGIESDAETFEFGTDNLKKAKIDNVIAKCGNGLLGWKKQAPFDAIVITFAIDHIPRRLFSQLSKKGRIIAPVKATPTSIECHLKMYRAPNFSTPAADLPGFRFVESS